MLGQAVVIGLVVLGVEELELELEFDRGLR
jgi:hypothetical protein